MALTSKTFKILGDNQPPKPAGERPPAHADELAYLFEMRPPLDKFFPKITKDNETFEFSKNFVSLWTSFALNGYRIC